MTDDQDDTAPAAIEAPLQIVLEGGVLSAAALAALAPGSVLPLPDRGGALPVQLYAGETRWASGELVAVGDGYGVLIERVRGDGN